MEQKIEISNIQDLYDWINRSKQCYVVENDKDYFIIEAPNNASWQIQFEEDDNIEDIICKTIEQLEEFDADERFTELWSADFAKRNCFTPLQFINMLKEDEASFKELAEELKRFTN